MKILKHKSLVATPTLQVGQLVVTPVGNTGVLTDKQKTKADIFIIYTGGFAANPPYMISSMPITDLTPLEDDWVISMSNGEFEAEDY